MELRHGRCADRDGSPLRSARRRQATGGSPDPPPAAPGAWPPVGGSAYPRPRARGRGLAGAGLPGSVAASGRGSAREVCEHLFVSTIAPLA